METSVIGGASAPSPSNNLPISSDAPLSVSVLLAISDIIARLHPLLGMIDHDDHETFKARIISDMSLYMKNLAEPGKTPRMYLNVAGRLVCLADKYPYASVIPFIIEHDSNRLFLTEKEIFNPATKKWEIKKKEVYGYAVCGAIVFTGRGPIGVGIKHEDALGFEDYLEKALTGAVGRALPLIGIGTQFARELDEGDRIVDAGIDKTKHMGDVAADSAIPAQTLSAASQNTASSTTTSSRGVPNTTRTPTSTSGTPNPPTLRIVPNTTKQPEPSPAPTSVGSPSKNSDMTIITINGYAYEIPNNINEVKAKSRDTKTLINKHELNAMFEWRKSQIKLPEKPSTWDLKNFQDALAYSYLWMDERHMEWGEALQLPAQAKEIVEFIAFYGAPAVAGLCIRICNTSNIRELTCAQADILILAMIEQKLFTAIIADNDENFGAFRKDYPQLSQPLDLVDTEGTKIKEYREKIRTQINEKQRIVSKELEERNKKELEAFLHPAS